MILNDNFNPSTGTKVGFFIVMCISLLGFFTLYALPAKEVALALFHKYHTSIFLVKYGIPVLTWMFFIVAAGSMWEVLKSFSKTYVHADPVNIGFEKRVPVLDTLSRWFFLFLESDVKESALLEHYRLIRKNQKLYIKEAKKKFRKSRPDVEKRMRKAAQQGRAKDAITAAEKKSYSMDLLIGALELHAAK